MAKDNTARQFASYIWFLDTIYNCGPISKAEIMRRYERNDYINPDGCPLTERTFYRWRNDVEQLFDINIQCNHNRDNLFFIECDEDIKKEGLKRWLLNSFSLKSILNESGNVADRILVEDVPSGQKFLTEIVSAIKDNVEIELVHRGFEQEHDHTFHIQPYCVKLFKQRWYVYGFVTEYKAARTFALDRVKSVTLTQEKFRLPKGFDAASRFADRYGISLYDDEQIQTIRLKVDATEIKYLQTLPIHTSQTITESTDEYSIVELRLVPTYELKQEIRRYGPEIEVLEPLWLRNDMLNDAKRIVEAHKRKKTYE